MKAVILAGGFGTRLERDLRNEENSQFSHLVGVPKPLLPIGPFGESLISHWTEALKKSPQFDEIIVVTNGVNHQQFEEWAKSFPEVTLVCDGAMSNEERSGAVACMNKAAKAEKVKGDTLFIGGDTLFYDGFSLSEITDKFQQFKKADSEASMVLYVTCSDEEVHKYGILETDENSKVTGFLEKPQATETDSRKECPCFYIFNEASLDMMDEFLFEKKDGPMKARDATGNFVAYLHKKKPVYAMEVSGRFDVGGLESYLICQGYFVEKHGMIDLS